jgi:transcriptional regulator with XRE-family HTH domain
MLFGSTYCQMSQEVYNNYKMEETLGQLIKRIRKDQHLSQEDVAARGGRPLTRVYVNQLEHDRVNNPTRPTLGALAKGLGVSPLVFFEPGHHRNLKTILGEAVNALNMMEEVTIPDGDIVLILPNASFSDGRIYVIRTGADPATWDVIKKTI